MWQVGRAVAGVEGLVVGSQIQFFSWKKAVCGCEKSVLSLCDLTWLDLTPFFICCSVIFVLWQNQVWYAILIIVCLKISCMFHIIQFSQGILPLHVHMSHLCRIEYFRTGSQPMETLRNNENFLQNFNSKIVIKFEAFSCTYLDRVLYLQFQSNKTIIDFGYTHTHMHTHMCACTHTSFII